MVRCKCVHFFNFLASVFVHADYVDEVSGGVEEGGVAGHVVAVVGAMVSVLDILSSSILFWR